MSNCRWDRTAERHLLREHLADCTDRRCEGCKPCTHDDDGNPVRHCRCRRRCTSHLGWDEYACPTCLAKIRANLVTIEDNMALMPAEATLRGIGSEPANLAGPHADYVSASWRAVNAVRNGAEVEELDMLDPYTCLTMHERTIRELLGHDQQTLVSPVLGACVSYLSWVLTDLARDEEHAAMLLPALLADTGKLRSHMEAVLRDSRIPERGAPCLACVTEESGAPRVVRHYAEGMTDTTYDTWVCPSNRRHWWWHADYLKWAEDRMSRRRA